jgi:peptidoglycan/xylan/chitin deacetylase (PgdA/CDA1 family)
MSAKTLLRNGAARFLALTGLTSPGRRSQGRFSIVTFHRVLPEAERQAYPYPGLVVTPQELDAYLTYLTKHFDCGALATQHQRHLSGEIPSRPLLAITLDDGQQDNYRYARPMLARHRVKATFFVPVVAVERQELLWHDRVGFAVLALLKQDRDGHDRLMRTLAAAGLPGTGPGDMAQNVAQAAKGLALEARMRLVAELAEASGAARTPEFARPMTYNELAVLEADGHEIGSHSMTHCLLPECDDRALIHEVSESRSVLRERLSLPIESFCYPNGDCDERSTRAVAEAGYRRAVTTRWGGNGRDADRFRLRRFDMDASRLKDSSGEFVPAVLAFRMSGLYPGLGSPG